LYEYLKILVHKITTAHQPMLWLCGAIFLITFSITIYLIIEHRIGSGKKKQHFHKSICIEIMWAAIPFLIIFLLVSPMLVTVF
jgi:heme/copper-type cytochrome/quinol oxidase subunit 2